jgi:predicted MFS family arabinose efflux permease
MKNNKALKVLITYNSLFLFSSSLLGPLYAIFVKKIGGDILLISVSAAVFYLSSTIFLYFVSKWGDKLKEKEYLLVASYLVRAAAFLGYLFIDSAFWLIIIQTLFGLGDALGTPAFGAIFAKHTDKDEEVLEYSDWTIMANLVMAFGTLLGGFAVITFGFEFLFVVMGILCLCSALGIYLTPRRVL